MFSRLYSIEELKLDNVTRGCIEWARLNYIQGLKHLEILYGNREELIRESLSKGRLASREGEQEYLRIHNDKAEFLNVSEETINIFNNLPDDMLSKVNNIYQRVWRAWAYLWGGGGAGGVPHKFLSTRRTKVNKR